MIFEVSDLYESFLKFMKSDPGFNCFVTSNHMTMERGKDVHKYLLVRLKNNNKSVS